MVLRFWPRHLVDNGLVGTTDDAIVGQEGRRQYIAGIPRQNLLHLKGGRVSPSAWMSFQKVGAEWPPALATRAMVLATLCLEKGWLLNENLVQTADLEKLGEQIIKCEICRLTATGRPV